MVDVTQVDGFRFDIMGHHQVSNMMAVRAALDSLTLDKDGVDGRRMYVYGEAWDFGEMALNARGRNASQHNLGGSRLGAFNDRCVDVRMRQGDGCDGVQCGAVGRGGVAVNALPCLSASHALWPAVAPSATNRLSCLCPSNHQPNTAR